MKINDKVIITDISHNYFLQKGTVVYEGKRDSQRVVELENGIITNVNNNELAWQ